MTDSCYAWCTVCGYRLTYQECSENPEGCPKCGTGLHESIPCSPDHDYTIDINLHELRILTIWATNWISGKDGEGSRGLAGILNRLRQQLPSDAYLTMGDELQGIRLAANEMGAENVEVKNWPKDPADQPAHGPGAVGYGKRHAH